MDYYRRVSKTIKQRTPMMCYAAAFESWLGTFPGVMAENQDDIAADYGDANIQNGAPEKNMLQLLNDQNVQYVDWGHGNTNLTMDLVLKALRFSHVIFVYHTDEGASHAVVVYGVSDRNGVPQISFMDPWNGSYRWANLSDFDGKPWLVGWKRP